jgi:acyl-ACP thioesterase
MRARQPARRSEGQEFRPVSEPSREIMPRPPGVRAFSSSALATISDCAPSGRVRLDALSRWLQDVAYADIRDAGLDSVALWVVRRTRIRVNRWPRFGEQVQLTTFCTGLGRMWAERRTDFRCADGQAGTGDAGAAAADPVGRADVEGMSLWVHLDPERRLPFPLTEAEVTTYSGNEPQRRVTARLRHPAPPPAAHRSSSPWTFRATECDLAEHVNNAAYWQPLEEELLLRGSEPGPIDVELEYRAPAQPGEMRWVTDRGNRWIVDGSAGGDEEVHASFLLEPPR